MLHNVRLLSSYLKAISSWPEENDLTFKSLPSPYQLARKINISANSSYKLWNMIFQREYIKDILIMPEIFPGDIKRYFLLTILPFENLETLSKKFLELPFIELLHTSNYMKKKRSSMGVEDYMELGHIQFLSEDNLLEQKMEYIKNAFNDVGLDFNPINYFSYSEVNRKPTRSQLRLVTNISYKSMRNFSTEEITEDINFSRKKIRKSLDSIVENGFIKGKVIFNFKRIPNMITKQVSIMVPEENTNSYQNWVRSQREIRNNYIYFGNYPHTLTLTLFGETLEEIDDAIAFLSDRFENVHIIDRFDTVFYRGVKDFISTIAVDQIRETM
ncbi:MAG: hypothetical protein ACYCWK_09655 [Cuniculiplasma sp.]